MDARAEDMKPGDLKRGYAPGRGSPRQLFLACNARLERLSSAENRDGGPSVRQRERFGATKAPREPAQGFALTQINVVRRS